MKNWEQICKKENVRIKHFYCGSVLVGTMAYGMGEDEDQLVPVGMSIVSPKDNGNKERGREIAIGRCLKAKYKNPNDRYFDGNRLDDLMVLFTNKEFTIDLPMRGFITVKAIKSIITGWYDVKCAIK